MKFQFTSAYGPCDSKGHMIKRPVLMLELKGKDGKIFEVPAIVDSGADRTNVNLEYAGPLGIKLDKKCDTIGIGDDKVPGYLGTLAFKIRNTDIQMEIPATYIQSKNVGVLLGREVFFDAFRIIFSQKNNSFELLGEK